MKSLLELASEEIPARMQVAAADQLRTRFVEGLKAAGLAHGAVVADATPRRLWLIADGVAAASAASREERKGPSASAPEAAIAGFLRSTGLTREQLEERETPKGLVLFAHIASPGRSAAAILAELVPAIVRDFQWPKSMRWGSGTVRWVRPLTGIVALLDGDVVDFEAHGVVAGRETRGHRIHAPEAISVESAATYAAQLLDAKVVVSSAERRERILAGAAAVAGARGLSVIPDAGLVAENAGLTEWPVPMLGAFDPAFLAVPREVIQLTMRTNQKYFAVADTAGALAPGFVCVANLEASDGGAAIVAGNERVLSARLADAKFFWDQDVAAARAGGLEVFAPKLGDIVFHEKLGTVADKVARVAKLAEWLVTSGAVPGDAALARRAAELCKMDLVSATVGEFPEVQGIAGAYLARVAGEDAAVVDAIRDHYKPVGQGDDVPTAPVSVAVALADKLDTLVGFFAISSLPTGSRDPFALRRAALGLISLLSRSGIRLPIAAAVTENIAAYISTIVMSAMAADPNFATYVEKVLTIKPDRNLPKPEFERRMREITESLGDFEVRMNAEAERALSFIDTGANDESRVCNDLLDFFADRLKVQQREAGIRPDIIDAVFALGGEDDLVRLLARVRALQAFVATDDGTNLLAGYKRAANLLKIELKKAVPTPDPSPEAGRGEVVAAEAVLAAALDAALPAAAAAVRDEDFGAAMMALAGLRAPVDAFFAEVMVNDPDPAVRADRLALLARFRDAVHEVADFSKIEG
nr:glycine--tRNA ligase subunit beta [Polymorphobacter sp.]